MSFFSDLGSLIKEFNDIKDEFTQSVTDSVQNAIDTADDAKTSVSESVQEATDAIKSTKDDIASSVPGTKKIDIMSPEDKA